jgi:hypothetical protein
VSSDASCGTQRRRPHLGKEHCDWQGISDEDRAETFSRVDGSARNRDVPCTRVVNDDAGKVAETFSMRSRLAAMTKVATNRCTADVTC